VRHVNDEHVKGAAQDVAQDPQEGVLGAAENGSVKVFIVASIVIFQRRNPRPIHACRPHAALERHANDVAQTVVQGVAEDVVGAAEDGSVKVFIVARVIFQRQNPRPTHAYRPPRLPLGDT